MQPSAHLAKLRTPGAVGAEPTTTSLTRPPSEPRVGRSTRRSQSESLRTTDLRRGQSRGQSTGRSRREELSDNEPARRLYQGVKVQYGPKGASDNRPASRSRESSWRVDLGGLKGTEGGLRRDMKGMIRSSSKRSQRDYLRIVYLKTCGSRGSNTSLECC